MTGSVLADAALFGVLGLLIGSFLNVVIHRLPRMMERQWAAECAQYAQDTGLAAGGQAAAPAEPFNLMQPRSRCPSCGPCTRRRGAGRAVAAGGGFRSAFGGRFKANTDTPRIGEAGPPGGRPVSTRVMLAAGD